MDEATNLAEETFCAALPMAPEERRAYLDQTCADNPTLRAKVERMLSRHTKADAFLKKNQPGIDVVQLAEELGPETLQAALANSDDEVEKQIGPYKLVERLGEGGCGAVYLAEQEKPVHRQVAFKIIKLGMDTKSFIARFTAERQALAMMDHPNIARVLDAGATEKGRPYFVMELVRGVKITGFCDANNYDLRQRLELFIKVCQAIQHAHQKGIIHRDIKPSNVLVTLIDGVPVPKVIDFGIAKAISGEQLTDLTVFTAHEHFVGTPAYMSPEQAELSSLGIDTRSDVYSLGVLLYELLTGKTPFDQKELIQSGLDEMRRKLREQEPPRPSTKLGGMRMEELTQTAVHRRLEPARLKLVLRGDLDWIVMKALEKDRDRRYQTAIGLGVDVRHYLNHEPVVARPPSRLYRFQKLVRRNRAVFISITAVSVALIAGFGTSTWLFFREREARLQEQEARREAQKGRENAALLRRQAEARETIAKAVSLVEGNQLDEADKLVGALPSSDAADVGVSVFRPLGDWAAVQGRLRRAAEYYSVLVRLDLFEKSEPATLEYTKYAVVLAELGDRRAYESFCRESIRQYGGTADATVAERLVKNSLLLPADASLLDALSPLAQIAAESVPVSKNPRPAPGGWMMPWRCLSLALFEYRRGNYDGALDWGNRGLVFDLADPIPPRIASIRAILAMAYHQLGQAGSARSELAKSRELVEARFRPPLVSFNDNDNREMWFDWFLGRILEHEAAAMIEAPASATK